MIRASRILGRARTAAFTSEAMKMEASRQATDDPKYEYLGRESARYDLHSIIYTVMDLDVQYRRDLPSEWLRTVILEWPHQCEGNPEQIAYTQNPDKGARDIQTPVGIGRYLKRVLRLPDHIIELLVKKATASGESTFKIVEDTQLVQLMVSCPVDGPRSCMAGPDKPWSVEDHPYRVYSSRFGWALVCRFEGDEFRARALVNGTKYVRVYGPVKAGGVSNSDDRLLVEWLTKQGYSKGTSWEGYHVALIPVGDQYVLAPYMDGDVSDGTEEEDYIEITPDGVIDFSQTNGYSFRTDPHKGQVQEGLYGDWINLNDACYLSYRSGSRNYLTEGYFHIDDCVRSNVSDGYYLRRDCSYITTGEWEDEYALSAVCVDTYDSKIALEKECVWAPTVGKLGEYILRSEGVQIDGEWYLKKLCSMKDGVWTKPELTHVGSWALAFQQFV